MGIFNRAFAVLAAPFTERRDTTSTGDGTSIFHIGGGTDAGVAVTPELAMTHAAVWACVAAISDAFSTLPVHVKKQKDGSTAAGHAVHDLLHSNPNEYMTPAMFRGVMMVNALMHGRAVAVIERDEMGRATGLYPVPSRDVRVVRAGGLMRYHIRKGVVDTHTLRPDEVFDLVWMSADGVGAMGPIQMARNTIGLGLAVSKYASRFFANGGNVGGLIKTGSLSPDAVKQFLASWREKYVGSHNAFKLAALPNGMDFTPIGTDPEKGQMLDTRQHQVIEICRIFRVPPHKIQDLSRATWSNIEWMQIDWTQGTLLPWAVRWEQEADRKLLLERERSRLEVKFNLDSLLRADTESRYRSHRTGIESGILTVNEARRIENLPPVEGGDVALRPANTVPLTAPAQAPPPKTDENNDDSQKDPENEPESPAAA